MQDLPKLENISKYVQECPVNDLHSEIYFAILWVYLPPMHPDHHCVSFSCDREMARLEGRWIVARICSRVELVHIVDNKRTIACALDGGVEMTFARASTLPLRGQEREMRNSMVYYIIPTGIS